MVFYNIILYYSSSFRDSPKVAHIKVCYALHALCSHMNWSIPDVLRINDFSIEVKLTVQQFSDQEKNRL